MVETLPTACSSQLQPSCWLFSRLVLRRMHRRVGGSSLSLGSTISASALLMGPSPVSIMSAQRMKRYARHFHPEETILTKIFRDRPRRSLRHQDPQQRRLDRRHGLFRLQHHDRPGHANRHGKNRLALLPALRRVQFHKRAVLLGVPA